MAVDWSVNRPHIDFQIQPMVTQNHQIVDSTARITELESLNSELRSKLAQSELQVHVRDVTLAKTYSSKSWRLTAPLRMAMTLFVRARRALFHMGPLVKSPLRIGTTALRLFSAWRNGGLHDAKMLARRIYFEASYPEVWASQYLPSFTDDVLALMQKRICDMTDTPLISVLLPTANTPAKLLRKTMDSVALQLYPNWELCIVEDSSSMHNVRQTLNAMDSSDVRIKVATLDQPADLATATNYALTLATGTHVVLLSPGDVLEPQALFRLAECILAQDPDMLYSDEATISHDGLAVTDPIHRPAFSMEYLRACPYILHLLAFRTTLLRQLGGLDVSLPSLHHFDLVLRAAENATRIVHIPEILYLAREPAEALEDLLITQVMKNGRDMLSRHLARCGETAAVKDGPLFNHFEVRYSSQDNQRVAIIIPTKNHGELLRQCIDSIARTVKLVHYDIVVIDHASNDPESLLYFEQLKESHLVLRYEGAFNFSAINNWAISQLPNEYTHYLFCNNDIEAIEDGWLEQMMELGQKHDVGIVGAKLLYPGRELIQHAGVCVGMYGIAEHYGKFMANMQGGERVNPGYCGSLIANHEMSAVTAACALMRCDVFERIGGFDEMLVVGFGDVDLCLKAREAGYRILFCAQATLVHHESYSRGKSREDPHPDDSAFFSKKWRGTLNQGDPYYNPNLTLQSTRWEVKQPMVFSPDIANRVWNRPCQIKAESMNRSQHQMKN